MIYLRKGSIVRRRWIRRADEGQLPAELSALLVGSGRSRRLSGPEFAAQRTKLQVPVLLPGGLTNFNSIELRPPGCAAAL